LASLFYLPALPIALLSVSIITAVYKKVEKYIDKGLLAIIITIKLVDIFDYHIIGGYCFEIINQGSVWSPIDAGHCPALRGRAGIS
jgi:hypothetical protein